MIKEFSTPKVKFSSGSKNNLSIIITPSSISFFTTKHKGISQNIAPALNIRIEFLFTQAHCSLSSPDSVSLSGSGLMML